MKVIKYNHLIANLAIFHNCHTITLALNELEAQGWRLTPELLASFSPFRTHHLNRLGLHNLKHREPPAVDYGSRFSAGAG